MSDKMVRYTHVADRRKKVWFNQYAKDPLPKWAANVETYDENGDENDF